MNDSSIVIVISGPSGVGKGTIVSEMLRVRPEIRLAVSACTRDPRPNEKDGIDYYFLTEDDFDQKVKADAFLEWCDVHNKRYGTLRSEVDRHLDQGHDVILEIDIQGAKKVRQNIKNVVSIFITPPSLQDLFDRLRGRNTDSESEIAHRLSMAGKELAAIGEYNYIVVNKTVDEAVADVLYIVDRVKSELAQEKTMTTTPAQTDEGEDYGKTKNATG